MIKCDGNSSKDLVKVLKKSSLASRFTFSLVYKYEPSMTDNDVEKAPIITIHQTVNKKISFQLKK